MNLQFGCECNCDGYFGQGAHIHGADTAPLVLVVERRGVQLRVCSRCVLPTDTPMARLYDELDDDEVAALLLHHGSTGIFRDCRMPWLRKDLPVATKAQ